MIKAGSSINLCVAVIIVIILRDAGYVSRTYIQGNTRVFDTRSVSLSTRWIARHISADIFFRQRKEISDDLAEARPPLLSPVIPRPLPPPGFFSFLLPRRILFLFNFFRRERMACRSRFKWVWRIAIARITLCFRDVRLRFL